jgi:hypothetical protein
MTEKNGNLRTALNGVLEIVHGDGVIEFRLRSEHQIMKRGVVTILRIEGLPMIPRIEDGRSVVIDLAPYKELLLEARVVQFREKKDAKVSRDRRASHQGAA